MDKVYVVYYDNGHSHEERDVSVSKIFLSENGAVNYIIQKNYNNEFVPSMTKQEFYSQDVDNIRQTYEDWLLYEKSSWDYNNCGRYFYSETEVFE
jgi:hypothetical protein